MSESFPTPLNESPANGDFMEAAGIEPARHSPRPFPLTSVYFIRCGTSGPIKIGIAKDVGARLRMLQIGNHKPLHLHAHERMDSGLAKRVERILHSRLVRSHIAGEWFKPDREVLEAAKNPTRFVADALAAQDRERGSAGMSDPFDLTVFKGPDFKKTVEGGIGKKKPAKNQVRKQASPKRKQSVRDKKVAECRVCPNTAGLVLHAHHLVREGAPWFGSFTENNIVGLCAECHHGLHAGDDRVKKVLRVRLTKDEVDYSDDKAYPGYVDDVYFALPKVGRNGLTRVGAGSGP